MSLASCQLLHPASVSSILVETPERVKRSMTPGAASFLTASSREPARLRSPTRRGGEDGMALHRVIGERAEYGRDASTAASTGATTPTRSGGRRPTGYILRMKHVSLRADAILLLAAALWGAAFVAQRAAMTHLGPLTYNGIRFTIGTLALLLVVAVRARYAAATRARHLPTAISQCESSTAAISQRESSAAARSCEETAVAESWRAHLGGGIAVGLVLLVAAALQQAGLVYTTAGKAGFITGLYVPLVPIFGLAIGQRTGGATWTGAAMAVAGLYLLSAVGPLHINRGDTLVILCAVVYAMHVLLVGKLAPNADPLKLAIVQFGVVAVGSLIAAAGIAWLQSSVETLPWVSLSKLIAALAPERASAVAVRAALWPILYGGLVSVAIAYTLQLVGQRHAPPAHAALVLSLETVFAAGTGYLVLGEVLRGREFLGAAIMLAGMFLSQVGRLLPKTAPLEQAAARVVELQGSGE
jgi:drug/metabolite transporter (DMT)-like permease